MDAVGRVKVLYIYCVFLTEEFEMPAGDVRIQFKGARLFPADNYWLFVRQNFEVAFTIVDEVFSRMGTKYFL